MTFYEILIKNDKKTENRLNAIKIATILKIDHWFWYNRLRVSFLSKPVVDRFFLKTDARQAPKKKDSLLASLRWL